jgi:hypothetical protein
MFTKIVLKRHSRIVVRVAKGADAEAKAWKVAQKKGYPYLGTTSTLDKHMEFSFYRTDGVDPRAEGWGPHDLDGDPIN